MKPRPEVPLRLPPEVADERVVAGAGTCEPPGHPDTVFAACCDAKTCSGYCVQSQRSGAVQCRCFDAPGGCGPGRVCCKHEGRCVPANECYQRKLLEP